MRFLGILPFLFMSLMAHALFVAAVTHFPTLVHESGAMAVEVIAIQSNGALNQSPKGSSPAQNQKKPKSIARPESLSASPDSALEPKPGDEVSTNPRAALAQPGTVTRWPRLLREEKIAYPHLAKLKGVEGEVTLKVIVGADGHPAEVEVLSGPGFGLNEAALQALRRFQFSPAYAGSRAVATSIIYKYKFTIRE